MNSSYHARVHVSDQVAIPPDLYGMNTVGVFLIWLIFVLGAWRLGRGLGRWSPVLRHMPWMILLGAGVRILYTLAQQDPGSTMGSGFAYLGRMILGGMLLAGGVLVGVLTWLFPGKAPDNTVSKPAEGAVPEWGGLNPEKNNPAFALLQQELDPEIPSEVLVQAARSVSSLQDLDSRMAKGYGGILFRGLTQADARRMKAELTSRGIPVYSVEESRLFPLPVGRRVQALRLQGATLVETDCLGREHHHALNRVVRCSAGRIEDVVYQEHKRMKTRMVRDMGGRSRQESYQDMRSGMEPLSALRLEFVLPADPYRIIWSCDQNHRRLLQNQPVGPDNPDDFESFLLKLSKKIAPERLNSGIRRIGHQPPWVYPSLRTFEEEIIWALTCLSVRPEEESP